MHCFFTIYFWEHMPGYSEDVRIHFQFELSVPVRYVTTRVTWYRSWSRYYRVRWSYNGSSVICLYCWYFKTNCFPSPKPWNRLTSVFGLCWVNFSSTVITLSLLLFPFLISDFQLFCKNATCWYNPSAFCNYLCPFVNTTMPFWVVELRSLSN